MLRARCAAVAANEAVAAKLRLLAGLTWLPRTGGVLHQAWYRLRPSQAKPSQAKWWEPASYKGTAMEARRRSMSPGMPVVAAPHPALVASKLLDRFRLASS